ncbi:MAG: hypothetical protein ACTSXP_18625 [Promethearchaeota archaeon]
MDLKNEGQYAKKIDLSPEFEDKQDILKKMKKYYFSMGIGDGASSLCRKNMVYGLAKIQLAQEFLGMNPDAFFISTPDETISRNIARWNSGFGYGGKLTWGPGNEKFIVLDVKPNYCGILVGTMDDIPQPKNLINTINEFLRENLYIDDFKIEADFHKSNHFIDIFEVKQYDDEDMPDNILDYVFFIHGSCPELRKENHRGIGLYIDKSAALKNLASKLKTPFGNIHYLIDTDAKEYLEYCKYADDFSKRKRLKIARFLFEDFKEISNPTHQGLLDYNTVLLGAQNTMDHTIKSHIFPIALRGDLPAYLVQGFENLNTDQIENLGFSKRANSLGLYERIKKANILPHGGGYAFHDIIEVISVFTVNNRRYFVCEMENDMGLKIIEEVSALEFSYRGKPVVKKCIELELGKPIVKLIPKYVLKL